MRKIAIRSAASLAAIATLFASSSAFARKTPAGMGTEGSLTVSADRLFGFMIESTKSEQTVNNVKVESTDSNTRISLVNPALGARLGLDYTVIPNLTIGAAVGLGFGSSSSKTKTNGSEVSTDGPSTMILLVAPRVGYLIDFTDNLGIWPRGGVTYERLSATTKAQGNNPESTFTSSQLSATVDVPLVIAPADHFAFTVGPFVDFPLTASSKVEAGGQTIEPDNAPKTTRFGLGAGILGSF